MRPACLAFLLIVVMSSVLHADAPIRRNKNKIPNQYLVMLKSQFLPTLNATANMLAAEHSARVRLLFKHSFIGFSADISDEQAALLARNPAVELVEENANMELATTATDTVASTEWAIDRIDQVSWYPDNRYTYCTTRHPSLSDVNPIFVYVFDGGVDRDHREFFYLDSLVHGPDPYRVAWTGYDFVFHSERGAIDPYYAPPGQYGCGGESFIHGTAVASLIAGRYIGVDKQAFIQPVRVVGPCASGDANLPTERVQEAIDYIIANAPVGRTHVANFSMFLQGDRAPSTIDTAVNNMIARNIVVVASANNQNQDLCAIQTPARVPAVITVGGTTNNPMDQRVRDIVGLDGVTITGSNYGDCVDIFAPGFNIRTAAIDPNLIDRYLPGRTDTAATSYSAALVSGAAARYLEQNPTATPVEVWDHLSYLAASLVTDDRSPNSRKPLAQYGRLLNVTPECQ